MSTEHTRHEHCVFCGIVNGTVTASVVYEGELVLGFMDINPVNEGHVLVVPKGHAAYLAELDEATGAAMFIAGMKVAAALRACGVRCEGVNLFLADGKAAFQEIFHTHLHVFPRFGGDEFKIVADWSLHPPREALETVAQQIRGALDSVAE